MVSFNVLSYFLYRASSVLYLDIFFFSIILLLSHVGLLLLLSLLIECIPPNVKCYVKVCNKINPEYCWKLYQKK